MKHLPNYPVQNVRRPEAALAVDNPILHQPHDGARGTERGISEENDRSLSWLARELGFEGMYGFFSGMIGLGAMGKSSE